MTRAESESPMNEAPMETEKLKELARENFRRWSDALATGDEHEVAKLYADGATFLPTLSPEFKHSPEATVEYFAEFLKKHPAGEVREEVVQPLGEGRYLHSGLYDFTIDAEDGRQVVEARFTFVWELDENGEWRIIHHHSSLSPKAAH